MQAPRVLALALLLALPGYVSARDVAWQELVPADAPPPPPPTALHDPATGGAPLEEDGPPAVQQEPNAPVVAALDGIEARLPGYVVPLAHDGEGRVIEFLLVPYYGACIHVPPPPSNQIIHVKSPEGVNQEALFQPYWVQGTLRVEQRSSALAEAGYSMTATVVELYELQ